MSSPASTQTPPAASAGKFLVAGLIGLVLTIIGAVVTPTSQAVPGLQQVAYSYLVGVVFWTAMAIGMLMWIMIHHIFDASWSVVLRRQFEHATKAFGWLLILFLPLIIGSYTWGGGDLVWGWMNPAHIGPHGHPVEHDILYVKKAGFLSKTNFTVLTIGFYLLWMLLSHLLRRNSVAQDSDGDAKWTLKNRVVAAAGIPALAFSLTAGAFYWLSSLEWHWYSTMYGVWFFANCMRGALSLGVILTIWLKTRGDYNGIINKNHLHSIGQLMLAFTIFWAYVTFSQYFLIWNANVPEETFWYNLREYGDWYGIGMVLVFGHFLLPFLALLSYRFKVTPHIIRRIAYWILLVIFFDVCYNILPALKDVNGNPLPFFSIRLLWSVTSLVGVGGICIWSYLRSFHTTKLIPIRDPRIGECLTHHE
jgi:hypothetical protein